MEQDAGIPPVNYNRGRARFRRGRARGKRIVGLTREGETVLTIARHMMKESDDLRRYAEERSSRAQAKLTVATTHFHARYTLLAPILEFRKLHPQVQFRLKQSDPTDVERMIDADEADLGITAQFPGEHSAVISVPCKSIDKILIAPPRHPLLSGGLTLERIAAYPLIIYDEKYTGGSTVMQAFQARGLDANVVLTAMDADVIKAYVGAGLGVSVVQSEVYDRARDTRLRAIDASRLFEPLVIVMMLKPRLFVNRALVDFAATVMPGLDTSKLESTALRR